MSRTIYLYAAPASPPLNVRAKALSSTDIIVSWDPIPAIYQNGAIVAYQVIYEPLETFDGAIGLRSMDVVAEQERVTLEGLDAFVNYSISVRAATNSGPGPLSANITLPTFDDGNNLLG